jgi:predicted GIY-YIG superfamily endonuclease
LSFPASADEIRAREGKPTLVGYETYGDVTDAIAREKQIKVGIALGKFASLRRTIPPGTI